MPREEVEILYCTLYRGVVIKLAEHAIPFTVMHSIHHSIPSPLTHSLFSILSSIDYTTTQQTMPEPTSNNASTSTTAPTQPPSNQPNSSTPTATSTGTNRGLPYYEKLRRELRDTLQRKRLMDKSMVCIPSSLSPSLSSATNISTQSNSTQTNANDLNPPGPTRRPNLPLRAILPRRDDRRKYHQRFRQLHQGLVIQHGVQRGRTIVTGDWRGGNETQGSGFGCREGILEEFCGISSCMFFSLPSIESRTGLID